MKKIYSILAILTISLSTYSCSSDDCTDNDQLANLDENPDDIIGNGQLSNTEWIMTNMYFINKDNSIAEDISLPDQHVLVFNQVNGFSYYLDKSETNSGKDQRKNFESIVNKNFISIKHEDFKDIVKGEVFPKEKRMVIKFHARLLMIHEPTDPIQEIDYDDVMQVYKKR